MAKQMLKKYNPAFLSKEELVASFVVRHTELELIVQTIRENVTESNQHILVIGPRGIGKTTLALRVAAEIEQQEDLSSKWYPLIFAEESYQVGTPGEFWLEALFHLARQTGSKQWKRTYEELHKEQDEERLRERALAQLMDFADSQGKRILLVVENFNMLVGSQISDEGAWILRHTLLHEPRVMLLATATRTFEQIEDVNKALFELFKLYNLEPLDEEQSRQLWASVTGEKPSDERVRPIHILTGGSPRLLAIVSTFAAKMSLKELLEDLMQLVDENTEYFKSHLDNLPAVERKAYLALAELWDPATARSVAKAARLEVSKTSSLLGRLMDRGMVTEANGRGRRKLYQVAERLYNIYYLMRRRGTPSQRVKGIVNFMTVFYGPEELVDVTQHILEEACELGPKSRRDHLFAFEAIFKHKNMEGHRQKLIEVIPDAFYKMEDVPDSVRQLVERESKDAAKAKIAKMNKLLETGQKLEAENKFEEAETIYRKAIETTPESPFPFALLGALLQEKRERYEEAEQMYRRIIELWPEDALGWILLGHLLHECLGRYEEAEKAYKKAIEGEPKNLPFTWGQLGSLLHEHLGRYEEAEECYRKALKLQPDNTDGWIRYGLLLQENLGKYKQAEKVFRKVVKLEPKNIRGWVLLGRVLQSPQNRYDEAEEAYHKACELEPENPRGWVLFSQLCAYRGQYEQSEKLLRQALELEPGNWLTRFTLSFLLLIGSERKEEGLELLQGLLEETEVVGNAIESVTNGLIILVAAGYGKEVLGILRESASAKILEPLVVGLRMYVGEDVKVAAEIMEIGKDVVKRIEKQSKEQEKDG